MSCTLTPLTFQSFHVCPCNLYSKGKKRKRKRRKQTKPAPPYLSLSAPPSFPLPHHTFVYHGGVHHRATLGCGAWVSSHCPLKTHTVSLPSLFSMSPYNYATAPHVYINHLKFYINMSSLRKHPYQFLYAFHLSQKFEMLSEGSFLF